MCIIVYKPQNVEMPDYKTLRNCFENNDDGAGYMFAYKDKVHIVKGLMSFNGFIKSLTHSIRKYGKHNPYVLHFRLSTQAGVTKDCTHPFPLSKDMNDLRKLKTDCDIGIAHNGIIYLTSSVSNSVSHSDTMEFITDYLSLIIKNREYYKDKNTMKLIDRLTDSRLAILDGGGHCELTGGKWIEDKGVFYSNDGFKSEKESLYCRSFFSEEPFSRQQSVMSQDEYPEEILKYERCYNPYTRRYEFDTCNCPVFEDSDDRYCDNCRDFSECYGFPQDRGRF